VLTALAGVDVELGHSGVKIAQLSAQAQGLQYLYIQPHAHLEHSRVGAGITLIGSAEFQLGFFAEVAKTTTKADPGRKSAGSKQVGANRRSNEIRSIPFRYEVVLKMQIFVGVEHEGNFKGQRGQPSIPDSVAIVHFKCQPV